MSARDFETATRSLLATHGQALMALAATSIGHGLRHGTALAVDLAQQPAALRQPGACFVTLNRQGKLRGCIGSPRAHRPLASDVAENGFTAAFRDPRFPQVTSTDLAGLHLHLSILSPASPMVFKDEVDLLGQLRIGTDGLIIQDGQRRALFLPSVWTQLPRPQVFLQHLKVKAGLKAAHWSSTFQAARFIAESVESGEELFANTSKSACT